MGEERMVIEIGEDGEIEVDLEGFKGKGCAAIMDLIENALGPAERKKKPEYDMRAGTHQQEKTQVKTNR